MHHKILQDRNKALQKPAMDIILREGAWVLVITPVIWSSPKLQ